MMGPSRGKRFEVGIGGLESGRAADQAFLKKTRTTPGHDLAIARQRAKEIQRG
jgi:hypothetical protein